MRLYRINFLKLNLFIYYIYTYRMVFIKNVICQYHYIVHHHCIKYYFLIINLNSCRNYHLNKNHKCYFHCIKINMVMLLLRYLLD